MRLATKLYVCAVFVAAAAAVSALYVWQRSPTSSAALAVVLLSAVALVAELLQFTMPRGARGSVAFVPYLSMVLIAPYWATPAAIVIVKLVTESARRVGFWKTLFNVSQHALAMAAAIAAYRALGGTSLLTIAQLPLSRVTASVGFPGLVAIAVSYLVNGSLVAGVIALNTESRVGVVWKDVKQPTAVLDVLAGPMVFVFAWVYAAYGPIAAIVAWVPFIGYRHAQKTSLELEQTNRELLELMVKSLEARDQYTSGHSRRVQQYCTIIARALGLSPKEVESIGHAALLHDVGKIHEKYAPILQKSDRLTPDEWRTMKEHPVDGAELVSTMTKLHSMVPAIRHHHENWDGTGYPDGLAGERIPLASRVIRFADTIDAMTTQRPYRAPLNEQQVRAEIVKCRGSQFDPEITDQLLSSPLWSALFARSLDVEPVRAKFALLSTHNAAGTRARRA